MDEHEALAKAGEILNGAGLKPALKDYSGFMEYSSPVVDGVG